MVVVVFSFWSASALLATLKGMVYSSFSKHRILQLRRRGKRAPSIVAVLKREVFKVTAAVEAVFREVLTVFVS